MQWLFTYEEYYTINLVPQRKIKYEGEAFIKGLETLVKKSRHLQQKGKRRTNYDINSESEIRSTVTTAISPNDFTFSSSSSPPSSLHSLTDSQAKY